MAARLASRPLLPSGVSEDMLWTVAGGSSACLFIRDKGVYSETASEAPIKKELNVCFGLFKNNRATNHLGLDITSS